MNPIIELYRGAAALMVMSSHFAGYFGPDRSWLNFLWTGVDAFFVISGFVFAPQVLSGKIGCLSCFLIRRFFRIYPLYALSVFAYLFLNNATPEQKNIYLLHHLLMTHTLHSREEALSFNAAYWSLPPELEFYLSLPFIALALGNSAWRWSIGITLALILHLWVFQHGIAVGKDITLRLHLPGMLIEFMLGMVAYRAAAQGSWSRTARFVTLIMAGALLSGLALTFIREGDAGIAASGILKLTFNTLAATAYAAMIAATANSWSILRENSWCSVIGALGGRASYGVYLFHNIFPPLTERLASLPLLRFGLSAGFTILIAFVLHYLVEDPFHRFGRNLSKRLAAGR